jgi:hypothetical protein
MLKFPALLALLLVSLVAYAQQPGAVPASAETLAGLMGGSGNLTFPGALVVSAWLIARWRPEFRLHLDLGERICACAERIAAQASERIALALERIHERRPAA